MPKVTKEAVRQAIEEADAMDLEDGAYWAWIAERAGFPRGDMTGLVDMVAADPEFFEFESKMDGKDLRIYTRTTRGPTVEDRLNLLRRRWDRVEVVGNDDGWAMEIGELIDQPLGKGDRYSYITHFQSAPTLEELLGLAELHGRPS